MAGWMADTVGFVALILNLYSMASRGEYRLRLVSAIANAIYVVYGVLISAAPVIIACPIRVVEKHDGETVIAGLTALGTFRDDQDGKAD